MTEVDLICLVKQFHGYAVDSGGVFNMFFPSAFVAARFVEALKREATAEEAEAVEVFGSSVTIG
jgi:hypothetical protein